VHVGLQKTAKTSENNDRDRPWDKNDGLLASGMDRSPGCFPWFMWHGVGIPGAGARMGGAI
jgi:hypothetical protein